MGKKRGEVGHAADSRLLSYYLIDSCAFKLQGMFTLFLMPSMLTTYLFYREKILLLLSVTFFLESYSNSPSFLTAVTLPCSHLSQKLYLSGSCCPCHICTEKPRATEESHKTEHTGMITVLSIFLGP